MYRYFIVLLAFAVSLPVFSGTRTVVTQTPCFNPYYAPYYGGDYYVPRGRRYTRNSRFTDINDLEKYAMNRNFFGESDQARLERLEQLAFGTIREGDIDTRYNDVRNAILSRPRPNYKTSLLRSIGNYFGGQLTGYTPSISDNDSFYSPYGRSSVTNYGTPWGRGMRINNYGINSGMGVRLLD